MAHSKSARKRIRQNLTARLRNRRRKEAVKQAIRAFRQSVSAGQPEQAAEQLKNVYRQLDRVAERGAIHKNSAARKKSRLAGELARVQRGAATA